MPYEIQQTSKLNFMLTLKELHDSYNNTHPKYPNPLVYHNMKDKELSMLKYKALRPYLECLEGQIIIYRERFIAFTGKLGSRPC